MFYVISKLIGFFIVPSNVLIGLGLVGAALQPTRCARAGQRLLVASVLLIAAIGVLPLWVGLTLPLENRFPPWNPSEGKPDGIIVLGGTISPQISAARGQITLTEAGQRIVAALGLARQYPAARVVYSGGSGELLARGPSEASFAGRWLEQFGVASNRIMLETRSRSTAENAAFTKQLVARARPSLKIRCDNCGVYSVRADRRFVPAPDLAAFQYSEEVP
jgi:uncharacterized SAM-binding protein YcdF (DUF218 family)